MKRHLKKARQEGEEGNNWHTKAVVAKIAMTERPRSAAGEALGSEPTLLIHILAPPLPGEQR